MSRPTGVRRVVFAGAAVTLSMLFTVLMLLAADLYAHHRAQRTAGLNIWGYRGPVAGAKRPGELRIAFLGGSTMFGYGVLWNEAIPAVVERELPSVLGGSPAISAVNLAYNNEGAYSFLFTLKDYAGVQYDLVVLYEGYNDLGDPEKPNTSVFRHQSGVYRLTGYFPILPLVLNEKAMALRTGGNLNAAYENARGGKTVFQAPLADRASAAALESLSRATDSLGRQLGRFVDAPSEQIIPGGAGCAYPWTDYCESVNVAIVEARAAGKRVVVASQPRVLEPLVEKHRSQQAALSDMIARRFSSDPNVSYLDLSAAADLANPALCYDGMHLTVAGNAQVGAAMAAGLAPVVRAMPQTR